MKKLLLLFLIISTACSSDDDAVNNNIVDTIAPVVTLVGDNPQTIFSDIYNITKRDDQLHLDTYIM